MLNSSLILVSLLTISSGIPLSQALIGEPGTNRSDLSISSVSALKQQSNRAVERSAGRARVLGNTTPSSTRSPPVNRAQRSQSDGFKAVDYYVDRRDYNGALLQLRPYLESGAPWAQVMLANFYDQGKGVERDPLKAFELYTKAAQQGHPQAQLIVGATYAKGLLGERDGTQARIWLERAVANEDTSVRKDAQALLSEMES